MKTFHIKTLSVGCPKNILESATYRKVLSEQGLSETSDALQADIELINTCGCLETLQKNAKDAISKSHDRSTVAQTQKKVVVAGCYPYADKGNNLKEMGIDFFPPGESDALLDLLGLKASVDSTESSHLDPEDYYEQPGFVTSPGKAFKRFVRFETFIGLKFLRIHNFLKCIMMSDEFHYVVVGKGCLGNCTFCAIKLAIGNPTSRPINQIVNNVRKGLLEGKPNIWLVSDDVGCWGHDINDNSSHLLREVLAIPLDMNLVLNYFEPEMFLKFKDQLLGPLSDRRVVQICIPVQTGSQALLRKMGRHYDLKSVFKSIKELRKRNPDLIMKSQYIVGFPGESWSDFFKTILSMWKFDGVGVNSYARLKYTPAYKLKPLPNWKILVRKRLAKIVAAVIHVTFLVSSLLRVQRYLGHEVK